MKRAALILALAFLLVYSAEARADSVLESTKESAEMWAARYDRAWDRWAVAYCCWFNKPYVWEEAEIWTPGPAVTDPEEWDTFRRFVRKLAYHYEEEFTPLWEMIAAPGPRPLHKWRALAQWVCAHTPGNYSTVKDARDVLLALRREYGPRPNLTHPLATMRRIERQWFKHHPHHGADLIEVEY